MRCRANRNSAVTRAHARLAASGLVLACALIPAFSGTQAHAQESRPPVPSPARPTPPTLGQVPERVTIPAGEFWMGRTRLWLMDEIGWQIRERYDDRPVHRVRLAAYALDTHEVTNAAYAAFAATAASGVEAPYHWGGSKPPAGKERLPVYNVSWFDASKYCAAKGGRLPTEAEWERAARGDVADLDYPWGNDYLDEASVAAKPADGQPAAAPVKPLKHAHSGSSTGPAPVGSYAPNGFGLFDLSGNLWEWTADWYDLNYYSESPLDNPTGPASGRYKVIRGGSWADSETRLGTVYYRNFTAPGTAQPTIGFRCAGPAPVGR
jgi:formylglycine-generating enzyme required for sulfatase activity